MPWLLLDTSYKIQQIYFQRFYFIITNKNLDYNNNSLFVCFVSLAASHGLPTLSSPDEGLNLDPGKWKLQVPPTGPPGNSFNNSFKWQLMFLSQLGCVSICLTRCFTIICIKSKILLNCNHFSFLLCYSFSPLKWKNNDKYSEEKVIPQKEQIKEWKYLDLFHHIFHSYF